MTQKPIFITLNEFQCRQHLAQLIHVSYDSNPWTEEQFLFELPSKWTLSFMVKLEDQVVGYCIMSSKFLGKTHIHHFMVKDTFRGGGIGSAMIDEARSRVVPYTELSLRVHSTNQRAIEFYTRHGFVVEKPEDDDFWMIDSK
jgi:ribosomal protein S18 acetylase RimI-like enzyme